MRAGLGAVGAIAPDILILYSKRFSMPAFEFLSWQYIVATILYVGLGAVVATIVPLEGRGSEWKAFGVGFSLPLVLASVASAVRAGVVTPRGEDALSGSLLDLMSLF